MSTPSPGNQPKGKVGRARCPHCQAINRVEVTSADQVFRCSECEQDFRIRPKAAAAPPPPAPAQATVRRFPVQCRCHAKLMVTYKDFGRKVNCNACGQLIKIPDWIAETKFSPDEFDDMFSESELEAISTQSGGR
jgi:transcription elongation factor Elf1